MLKTQLHPAVLQEALDAAANAAQKGLAQYFTPTEWAHALAKALPKFRPVVVDLTCGNGSLLAGARTRGTGRLLGCDIAPADDSSFAIRHSSFVHADLCQLYPLLRAVQFQADCFVLNPPWDLHWYRAPLADLARSEADAVRAAFAAHDGRTGRDTIDSTIATLCLALDRCSGGGEGFLIANNATLERLILNPGAPHAALEKHCWYHLVIPGNICQPIGPRPSAIGNFETGILYFARGHTHGLRHPSHHIVLDPADPSHKAHPSEALLKTAGKITQELHDNRLTLRKGPETKPYTVVEDLTWTQWQAAAEEWQRLHPSPALTLNPTLNPWNLWLGHDGCIHTQLSLYDQHSGRVDKKQAAALHELGGKSPMSLVVQRAHRCALEHAAFGGLYRVEPRLQDVVKQCVAEYHNARAPLYPLSKIQRLGYLDEQDEILCLPQSQISNLESQIPPLPGFTPGRSYPIRTQTLQVLRQGHKVNVEGGKDAVEWNGQELAIYLRDDAGVDRLFMDARLRDPDVQVHAEKPGARKLLDALGATDLPVCGIDFTLQELVDHFDIPDVPDVAALHPAAYHRNLKLLDEIEHLISAP